MNDYFLLLILCFLFLAGIMFGWPLGAARERRRKEQADTGSLDFRPGQFKDPVAD